MSKYTEYEKVQTIIKNHGGTVGPYKEINYGIQFDVTLEGYTSKVRIYESKKKGVTLDLSQVKYDALKDVILNINSTSTEQSGQSMYQSDRLEQALIGVDESGKGDYFGPLVIGAVYADESAKRQLMKLGVADSKKLTDIQIAKLAEQIKQICPYEVIVVDNQTYNKLYDRIQNLNILLAKGHAKIIQTLALRTEAKLALSDQFGASHLIEEALKPYALDLKIEQRPKAESNVVVAAASIIAREAFVVEMANLSEKYGQTFPKGAGDGVVRAGKYFVQSFGGASLNEVAKLHFKTTEQL